jgi:hypothetical protein
VRKERVAIRLWKKNDCKGLFEDGRMAHERSINKNSNTICVRPHLQNHKMPQKTKITLLIPSIQIKWHLKDTKTRETISVITVLKGITNHDALSFLAGQQQRGWRRHRSTSKNQPTHPFLLFPRQWRTYLIEQRELSFDAGLELFFFFDFFRFVKIIFRLTHLCPDPIYS